MEGSRVSNWKTLEQFEAELRQDGTLQKKMEEREPDYLLAREILAVRLSANMSQSALARAIGTSQSRVSKWERGEEAPRVEALRRIAKATGRQLQVRFVAARSLRMP
jgi:DNA-binding transcriptional regulator YiaG